MTGDGTLSYFFYYPLFISILVLLYNKNLSSLKPFIYNAFRPPSGIPFKRTSFFEKSALRPPFFTSHKSRNPYK